MKNNTNPLITLSDILNHLSLSDLDFIFKTLSFRLSKRYCSDLFGVVEGMEAKEVGGVRFCAVISIFTDNIGRRYDSSNVHPPIFDIATQIISAKPRDMTLIGDYSISDLKKSILEAKERSFRCEHWKE